MDLEITDASLKKAVFANSFLSLVILLFFWVLLLHTAVEKAFLPLAATRDEGKTISYFLVPTPDEKTEMKVFPGSVEYEKALKKDYELIYIAPNEKLEKLLKEEFNNK